MKPEPATRKRAGPPLTVRGATPIQPADLRTSSRSKEGTKTTKHKVNRPVTLKVRIYEIDYHVEYESEELVDQLLAEFLSGDCRGRYKPPGKDGKKRRLWRCVMCRRDDFCSKHAMQHHRFVRGCPALGGKITHPYPDMESGQGKTGEMFRKGKDVQFKRVAIERKPTDKEGKAACTARSTRSKSTKAVACSDDTKDACSTDDAFQVSRTCSPALQG